jgi:hypothetical protein
VGLLGWGVFGAGLGVQPELHCILGFGFLVRFARVGVEAFVSCIFRVY